MSAMRSTLDLPEVQRRLSSQVYRRAEDRAWAMGDAIVAKGLQLLTGSRSGRMYRFGGTWYRASAPGELPAERSGHLRHSGRRGVIVDRSNARGFRLRVWADWTAPYAPIVAGRRPLFPNAILEAAKPELRSIAHRSYTRAG